MNAPTHGPVGLIAYGSYVPKARLSRAAISAALQTAAGRGERSVASYDEDATTMGVAAARNALAATKRTPQRVWFATTAPPYADKTNATAIFSALALPSSGGAYDVVGAVRSAMGAVHAGLDSAAAGSPALVVTSDVRTGLPGSADETQGGDGAAALLFGAGDVIAEVIGKASVSHEFLDRWRTPGSPSSQVWEERFGETAYVPLAKASIESALNDAGVKLEELDHVIIAGSHERTNRVVAASLGVGAEVLASSGVTKSIGNTGSAQAALALAAVLDRAEPDNQILMVSISDGADAVVFRVTEEITRYVSQRRITVDDQIANPGPELAYPTFLIWRGMLRREPPRRPDPERTAAPPSLRSEAWKFALVAGRCRECDTRHLPPMPVCMKCRAVDSMDPEPMADVPGRITTLTVDRLAYSLSPPVLAAVIDFEGGGRLECELTDAEPDAVGVGDEVEMTFRRLLTAGGVHNYFWKARPTGARRT